LSRADRADATGKGGKGGGRVTGELRQIRVGVDIGGTFTDLVMIDSVSGEATVVKASTTPDDPSRGFADAVDELGVPLAEVDAFMTHGSTTAINARRVSTEAIPKWRAQVQTPR
jgi:predicted NBD/HSP70 family sugar kinase